MVHRLIGIMGVTVIAIGFAACSSPVPAPLETATFVGTPVETATLYEEPPTVTLPPEPNATAVPPEATSPPSQEPSRGDLADLRLSLTPVVDGLDQPVGVVTPPDGTDRLFIVERTGNIRVWENGVLRPAPFLNISRKITNAGLEQGLLGLAFSPNYAEDGLFFVNYSLQGSSDTIVAQYQVSTDPNLADPDSEVIVLRVAQPAPNHNGGDLVFGPDGYLYIGLGDGGGANDRYGNGQNGGSLLGKMLRIDVTALPYTIPPDNPFVDDPDVLDEIWATGLRNPWRYSFDRVTGDLYIADVGQNTYEEINYIPGPSQGGENYGWPVMEGFHCFQSPSCDQGGLVLPVFEYSHTQGCSVTGGEVYRGSQHPALQGVYLLGDFCSGTIWGIQRDASGTWLSAELLQTGARIAAFGAGPDGELYMVDMAGTLYRLGLQG